VTHVHSFVSSSRRSAGFTLVELLVAMLVSMLLAVALMRMQASWVGRTQVVNADVATRDDQARVAMDRVVADLSSGGFLFGGSATNCAALFAYNTTAAAVVAHHPVDAQAAVTGARIAVTPNVAALTYPPTGSIAVGKTDVLVMAGAVDTSRFTDANAPVPAFANAVYTPLTTGQLPMSSTSSLTAGHIGIVQVPDSGSWACLRVPISTIPSGTYITSSGTNMPPTFYNGFAAAMTAEGLAGTLSNTELYQSKVLDIGSAASPNQTLIAYYIDNNSGSFPILKRASVNLLDDSVISTQDVAAGIVSMQVVFGVDVGNTGSITNYYTAATVTTNKQWASVKSVKVALVARSINADPDANYSAASPIVVKSASDTVTPFQNITLSGSDKHHYTVQTTEIYSRNLVW
jgi:Tfp pilus assembly protein PilW